MPQDIIIGRDDADKKRFSNEALIYLGKLYVKMGQLTSLSNRIMMDVARSHVVLISGKRGTGKSYSLSVIAEEISTLPKEVSENIAPLIFDTMGIFWTMQYRNEKELELLREWKLEAKKIPVRVLVPFGHVQGYIKKGIPVTKAFALMVSEMSIDDWLLTFGLEFTDPISIVLQRNIAKVHEHYDKTREEYDIDDILESIRHDNEAPKHEKDAALNLMESAKVWGLFARKHDEAISVSDILEGGKTTVIDVSVYSAASVFNVRALVIGLLCKKIFNIRMEARKKEEVQAIKRGPDYLSYRDIKEVPMAWIFIDEGHEFLPRTGKTPATDALIQLLREGRQPGISLVLATQQPGKIHTDAMTQSDIVISHKVTAKPDIDALNFIMQTYLFEDIKTYINNLENLKGSAIILDDNSERIYPMRVRARFTWHGGEAPVAIKVKKAI